MIHFVGAGPGAPDLITLRGHRLLCEADVIIYAGSLVNPALLDAAKEGCAIHNSACMTLEEVLAVMEQAEREQKTTVRLHTGDPCLYGAIQEQMDALRQKGIPYAVTPPCLRNIPCPAYRRRSSSRAWRAAPRCRSAKKSPVLPPTGPRWQSSSARGCSLS